jgi:hypothetical protein
MAGKRAGMLDGSGIPVILDPPVGASSGRWNILVRKGQEPRAANLIDNERTGQLGPEGRPAQAPEATKAHSEAALRRTEALCDQILQELGRGSRILRQVAQRPEQKVESLLEACRSLAARQREVEARVTPKEEQRLETERAELLRQREAAGDPIVAERLSAALSSLDEQLRHRKEILITAKRLQAEQTRIYYELENLYSELLALRSADDTSTELAAADSRKELQQLSTEIHAVAEALSEANHGEDSMVTSSESHDAGQSGSDVGWTTERQRKK